jgi:hypothetical protein
MRRKTTGTGRMRYMKDLTRRFKNGFREGAIAKADLRLQFLTSVAAPKCCSSPTMYPTDCRDAASLLLSVHSTPSESAVGTHVHSRAMRCVAARSRTSAHWQAGSMG